MKRFLLLICCCLMLCLPAICEEILDTEGESLVAENEGFKMYLTYEKGKTLQFSIESKETGERFCSSPEGWETSSDKKKRMQTGSQLIVESIDKDTKARYSTNSQVSSVKEEGTCVTLIENGIRVDYDFPREKDLFRIPVTYCLDENGFTVNILTDEIAEYGEVFVQSISILPNFYGAEKSEEGYLFIPDGCGALIDFDVYKAGMKGYRQQVYGRDYSLTSRQQMGQTMSPVFPVLGILKENAGVMIIADKGSAITYACAYPAGVDTVYNSAYFEMTYRSVDSLVLADKTWNATDVLMVSKEANNRGDVSIHYFLLDGNENDYVSMARIYRDYLKNKGMIKSRNGSVGLGLQIYGGIKKEKSVLGFVVDDTLPMTTFGQAEHILQDVMDAGVNNVFAVFMGWNDDGLQDKVQDFARPERELGGKKGFKSLDNFAVEHGTVLMWDTDVLRIFETDVSHNKLFGTAQAVSGEAAYQYKYYTSTYQKKENDDLSYLLAVNEIHAAADGIVDELDSSNLSFSSLGEMLYSDFRYNAYKSRDDMASEVNSLLDDVRSRSDSLSVSVGNEYAVMAADQIQNLPLYDSGYLEAGTDVPFVSMVLRGEKTLFAEPMNQNENPKTYYLRLIETGVNPCFAITWQPTSELVDTDFNHLLSTEWSVLSDEVTEIANRWETDYAMVGDSHIIDHRIEGDIRYTLYENGTASYVNYGHEPQTMNGVTVEARGYVILKEE